MNPSLDTVALLRSCITAVSGRVVCMVGEPHGPPHIGIPSKSRAVTVGKAGKERELETAGQAHAMVVLSVNTSSAPPNGSTVMLSAVGVVIDSGRLKLLTTRESG